MMLVNASQVDFWSPNHFALDDEVNQQIWAKSPSLQLNIQPPESLMEQGSIGAQQAMAGPPVLPWVPDLVGKSSEQHGGVMVCASAYAGFIREYSTRQCGLSLNRYRNAGSAAEFQGAFLESVVSPDRDYYGRVEQLIRVGEWKPEQLLLTDLCRVSFVCRGTGPDGKRGDQSGDRVARLACALFEKYVDASEDWTWRRLTESGASCILALGTIAEHGLLRLFERKGCSVRLASDAHSWKPTAGAPGSWVQRYANPARTLDHWIRNRDFWSIEARINGFVRNWFLLPVRHPATNPDYSRYKENIRDIRTKSVDLESRDQLSDGIEKRRRTTESKPTRMKALQLEKPLSWKPVEIPEPPNPAAGEALLRVHRIGICGTDISGYLGKMPFFSYPRIPGHELGVEVLAVGDGGTNIKIGDRCSVEPYINCGHCHSCRRGYTNCCTTNKTLGVMCDGGMTERIILPARKLHPSAKLNYEQLALVETLAIGCHAVNRGNPKSDEAVLVIGAGPIGLSVIEFAKLAAKKTIVMDMNEQRLAFVREKMGVAHTILAKGDGSEVARLEALTDGQLADVVVDATGSNKSMAQALNYCAFKGRLVYVGITQAEVSIPHAPALHRRELDILASRNALPGDFTRIIKLIEDGQIDTNPWITHHSSFDEMINVFPSWTQPETGVIKAIVEVN